jgi:hypothetical protein
MASTLSGLNVIHRKIFTTFEKKFLLLKDSVMNLNDCCLKTELNLMRNIYYRALPHIQPLQGCSVFRLLVSIPLAAGRLLTLKSFGLFQRLKMLISLPAAIASHFSNLHSQNATTRCYIIC